MAIADIAPAPAGEESYHVASPYLGASKISTYLKCPRQYEYTYVLKLPTAKSPQAQAGTVIHRVVRMAHEGRWGTDHAPRAAEVLQALWEEQRGDTSDPDHPQANQTVELAAREWLPWYLHMISKQVDICVEERWQLTIGGVALEGTIDRIYRERGQVVLSDVKSGARKPSPADLHNDTQLSIYAKAARELGLREDRAELVWLRTQERLVTVRTDDYLDAVIEQTVKPVAAAIEAATRVGMFPANPQSKYGCSFCGYQHLCDVGRGCEQGE